MTGLWWLLLGLLAGWLIELAIDFTWWRKRHAALKSDVDEQHEALARQREALVAREAQMRQRELEISERETVLNGRDTDVMAQAQRIDERSEAITRSEQRLDSRRTDLERQSATLAGREREIGQRHQALRDDEAKFTERSDRLAAAEADADKRAAMLGSRESGLKKWEQRILAKEKDLNAREGVATRLARDSERWRRHFHGMRALIEERYVTADGSDDLKVIHGIGRVAEKLLRSMGIVSFSRLAEAPLGELSRLAERGGSELALADPMSWAEQAQLIIDRDYIGFENLKARLRGDIPPDGIPPNEVLEVRTGDDVDTPEPVPLAAEKALVAAAGVTPLAVAESVAPKTVSGTAQSDVSAETSGAVASGAVVESVSPKQVTGAAQPGVSAETSESVVEPSSTVAAAGSSDSEPSPSGDGPAPAGSVASTSADPSSADETRPALGVDVDDAGEGLTDDAAEGVSLAALEAATREVGAREGGLTGGPYVGRREIEPPRDTSREAAIVHDGSDTVASSERRQERFAFASPTPSRGGGRRRRR